MAGLNVGCRDGSAQRVEVHESPRTVPRDDEVGEEPPGGRTERHPPHTVAARDEDVHVPRSADHRQSVWRHRLRADPGRGPCRPVDSRHETPAERTIAATIRLSSSGHPDFGTPWCPRLSFVPMAAGVARLSGQLRGRQRLHHRAGRPSVWVRGRRGERRLGLGDRPSRPGDPEQTAGTPTSARRRREGR